ncbi:hypothetical protein [Rhizobium sp.]
MANKAIKGGNKSYVVDDSKNTYTLGEKVFQYYGDKIKLADIMENPENLSFGFGYGIYEDPTSGSDFRGNTYNIDGKLTGLLGGIATYGDGSKINIGKTADVNAQLGINLFTAFSDPEDPGALAGMSFGTIFAGGDKAKITIAKGAEIGGLFGVVATGQGSAVTNSGEMDNALVGIMAGSILGASLPTFAKAGLTTTKLTNNGSIEAGVGIVGFAADNQVLTNGKKGEIEGLIGMVGGIIPLGDLPEAFGNLKMTNAGDIIAAVGMLGIYSPNMSLTNAKGAEIIAGGIGIAAISFPFEGAPEGLEPSIKITNAGTIINTINFDLSDIPAEQIGNINLPLMPAAILGGAGDEVVLNTGKISGSVILGEGNDKFTMKAGLLEKGDIILGGGDDTFSLAGGQIKGSIYGGEGGDTFSFGAGTLKGTVYGGDDDDTYVITKAVPKIVELENEGIDTVKSAVSYTLGDHLEILTLTGKANINATGNDLNNILTGNAGNNKLTGGAGLDTFVFGTGGGKDTITDFTLADLDILDVSKWSGIEDLAGLKANATEKDGDLIITLDKDVLTLKDFTLADLDLAAGNLQIVYAV